MHSEIVWQTNTEGTSDGGNVSSCSCLQMPARYLRFINKEWEIGLINFRRHIISSFGISLKKTETIHLSLSHLLLQVSNLDVPTYNHASSKAQCQQGMTRAYKFDTLAFVSTPVGDQLELSHNGNTTVYENGMFGDRCAHTYYYTAFFTFVRQELKQITSGCRQVLVYNVVLYDYTAYTNIQNNTQPVVQLPHMQLWYHDRDQDQSGSNFPRDLRKLREAYSPDLKSVINLLQEHAYIDVNGLWAVVIGTYIPRSFTTLAKLGVHCLSREQRLSICWMKKNVIPKDANTDEKRSRRDNRNVLSRRNGDIKIHRIFNADGFEMSHDLSFID